MILLSDPTFDEVDITAPAEELTALASAVAAGGGFIGAASPAGSGAWWGSSSPPGSFAASWKD